MTLRLDRARRVKVEFEDGVTVTLTARRVGWSYGVEWAEEFEESDGRARVELCAQLIVDHVTGIEGVEDEHGAVEWPDDDDAARELCDQIFSARQKLDLALHLAYEDSAGKPLRSVVTV